MKKIPLLFILSFFGKNIEAKNGLQDHFCNQKLWTAPQPLPKTTIADPDENLYDIHHLYFDISLNNTNTTVGGSVTTSAVCVVAPMADYVFELSSELMIDSVKINGTSRPFTSNGAVRKVNLSSPLQLNNSFTAQVFYHGTTPNGSGFFTRGLNVFQSGQTGSFLYTCSDPNWAKDWWPCKASLLDKIDSVDMHITVPDSVKAGSNGLLKQVVTVGNNALRYEWKTNYPIDYYLISAVVGKYFDYSYQMTFDNSTDHMLIQNYLYDTATYWPLLKPQLDSTQLVINYYSKLFGRYPFWKEKYGHGMAIPLGGGMEHQTMTTIGGTIDLSLISHELAHQWWGNHVTYSSWADIWLSEGFASYCEQLMAEYFYGTAAARQKRDAVFSNVTSSNVGVVIIPNADTNNVNRIFDSRLTYRKGAAVVHMLRYVVNHDSLFFEGLKNYQSQFAFGSANTAQFQQTMAQTTGLNLDTFFQQWVYGQGFPKINLKWYEHNGQVLLRMSQAGSAPTITPLFRTPVELRLKGSVLDTVVRLAMSNAQNDFNLSWTGTLDLVELDPNNNILDRFSQVAKDTSLVINEFPLESTSSVVVFPNPSDSGWTISGLNDKAMELKITNLEGKEIWSERTKGRTSLKVNNTQWATGQYFLWINTAPQTRIILTKK